MTSTVDEYVSRFLATQANLPDSACATPSRIHFFKKPQRSYAEGVRLHAAQDVDGGHIASDGLP